MPTGSIAALIAAIAFAVLVIAAAIPLIRLGSAFGELQRSIKKLTEESLPAVQGASTAMEQVNTVTASASRSAEDLSALATLLSATLGKPLIKISAFSYATRRALRKDKEGQK